MSKDTTTIELPSGHVLELKTRMTFGMMLNMTELDSLSARIALFAESWSFEEPITAEAIEAMDIEDGIALMEAFNQKVIPLFEGLMKKVSENSPNGFMRTTSPTSGEPSAPGEATSEK